MPKSIETIGVLPDRLPLSGLPEIADLLLESKQGCLRVKGLSMYPTLRPGDQLFTEPVVREGLFVGDLVLFQGGEQWVCHRVIEIFERDGGTWVRTRGDAMTGSDFPTNVCDLLGKVRSIERKGRHLVPSATVRTPLWKESLLFFVYRLREGLTPLLRRGLLRFQGLPLFRKGRRVFLRPKVEYFVGIPVSCGGPPGFWSYRPLFPLGEAFSEGSGDRTALRLLAKRKGSVVGSLEVTACDGENRGEWRLNHLLVKIRFRGCGIATGLLTSALRLLHQRGVSVLTAEADPQNRAASAFFQRFGFIRTPQGEVSLSLSGEGGSVRERVLGNVARQVLFEQALLEINEIFQKGGVSFLVLKGMALAYLIYPDPAARGMVDIDLFIHPGDLQKAIGLLSSVGYQPLGRYREYEEEMARFGGELAFGRTESPTIELHWIWEQYERLKGVLRIDEASLWQRAISYSIRGIPLKTPCPEDQLLTLSLHLGLVHRMGGLKWLLDIDRLIRTYGPQIDWSIVTERAKSWGIYRLLSHTLWFSQRTFGTPLPPAVKATAVLWGHGLGGQWFLLDRWQDRLRMLKRAFLPSNDWIRFRYRLKKGKAVFPYRILHPVRLLFGKLP